MYSEWTSLCSEIENNPFETCVLQKFGGGVSTDVASNIVKNLAKGLGQGATGGEASLLTTDNDVKWTMEVSYWIDIN